MKKHTGGRLLGQGTYGCVFSPTPRCVPEGGPEGPDNIGKVFAEDKHLADEIRMAALLKKIDPKQRYFIYPLHACKTTMRDLAYDPDVEECEFIGATRTAGEHEYPMVIMPRVDASLIKMLTVGRIGPADFTRAIEPVFKGLALLAKNKIVHNDLKFDNILYDPRDRVFKIIDFGISVNLESAFKSTENAYINVRYWLHPPEYRVWSYLRKRYPAGDWPRPLPDSEIRDIFKQHMTILNIQMTKAINLRKILLEHHNYCDYERAFMEWIRKLTKKPDLLAATAYINKYAAKIDLYCLGINLMVCIKYLDRAQDPEMYKKLYDMTTVLTSAEPFRRRVSPLHDELPTARQA